MHEHHLAQEILRVALAAAPDGTVRAIDLVVGNLTIVANESIRFHFDLLSQGTLAEGAILRFSPQVLRCPHCNAELSGEMFAMAICPSCGQSRPDGDGTGGCYVQRIEID
jgi:hydrogenase nickel incorporation protein HypA/HybF